MVNIIDETSPFALGLYGGMQGYYQGMRENHLSRESERRDAALLADLELAKHKLARDADLAQQAFEDRQRRHAAEDAQAQYEAQLRPLELDDARARVENTRSKLNMQGLLDEQTAAALADKPELMHAQAAGFENLIAGLGPLDDETQNAAEIARGIIARTSTPESQADAIEKLWPGLQMMQEQRIRTAVADRMDRALREGHFEEDPEIQDQLAAIRDELRAGGGDVVQAAKGFRELQAKHAQHLKEDNQRVKLMAAIDKHLETPDPFEPHSAEYVEQMESLRAMLSAGMPAKEALDARLKIQMAELKKRAGSSSYEYTPGKAYATAHAMALSELEKGLISPKQFQEKVREHIQQLLPGAASTGPGLPFAPSEIPTPNVSGAPTKGAPSPDLVETIIAGRRAGKKLEELGIPPEQITPEVIREVQRRMARPQPEKREPARSGQF